MKRLRSYWSAGVPGVVILSSEEERVLKDVVREAANWTRAMDAVGKPLGSANLILWSATDGLLQGKDLAPNTKDPLAATAYIRGRYKDWIDSSGHVVVWRDLGSFPLGNNPMLIRAVRDMLAEGKGAGTLHIFLGPRFEAPPEYARMLRVIEYSLPSEKELSEILEQTIVNAKSGGFDLPPPDPDARRRLIRGMAGLTAWEAEDALAVSIAETENLTPGVVFREKVNALRAGGAIQVQDAHPGGLDAIGGLDLLKKWLLRRKRAWEPEAETAGVRPPKGVLLAGIPGSGKSLTAKTVATAYGLIYARLDMGRIYGSLVGQSELNLRTAIQTIEALSPCVLHIDELEKAFSGFQGGGGDSGVSRRVGGRMLEWMQDQTGAFVVATANDISSIPPEFLRAGRFDAIFGLDLPNQQEREEILKLKLRERSQEVVNLNYVSARLAGYSGGEIEAVVNEGLLSAYLEGRPATHGDLVAAADMVKPQSVTMPEKIEEIRNWVRQRAMAASSIGLEGPGGRKMSAFETAGN